MFFSAKSDGSELILSLIIFGAGGIYKGYRTFANRRKVEDTACSTVASAPMGLAEVQGYAWPTTSLQCLDGRPAAFWSLVVEEERGTGKNRKWVQVYSYASSHPMLVTDKTGTCAVHPEGVEWEVTVQTRNSTHVGEVGKQILNTQAPEALMHLGGSGVLSLISQRTRVTERFILAGGPVYVRGHFTAASQQTAVIAVGEYQSFVNQMEKVTSPRYAAMMFDRDKDGTLSEEEMTTGLAMAANPYLRETKAKTEKVNIAGYFIADATHGLLVADTHQAYLVKRLGKQFYLYLYGGFASFAAGLYLFLQRL